MICYFTTELHAEWEDKESVVEFDFLGKDSVRYWNFVPVEKRVSMTEEEHSRHANHVIGVRLPSQSARENHNQEKKKPTNLCVPREFLKQTWTMFYNHKISF